MYEKLKSFIADDAFFTAFLLILVGIISFGLGRQSVTGGLSTQQAAVDGADFASTEVAPGGFFTEAPASSRAVVASSSVSVPVVPGQAVVGSKTGSKYHLPTCPGAKQIKEENKVFFESVALARAAGYTPAANCPGLE